MKIENFLNENPRLIITALAGILIFLIKSKFENLITPDIEPQINLVLVAAIFSLIGFFSRISKTTRIYLNKLKEAKKKREISEVENH